jgi:hypothetical protein
MAKKDKKASSTENITASSEIAKKFKQNPGIYIGSVVILVLVVVTFIGGDFLSGGGLGGTVPDFTFGYYDNVPISFVHGNFFSQNYEHLARVYQSQGADVNDFRIAAQIWRQAFEGAVAHTAILQIMKRSNYTVSDRIVNREVARLPIFQEYGRFSPTLYRQASESTRLTLWRQEQERLTKMMFLSDFAALMIPDGEAEFIANMASPVRTFEMVSFRIDNFPNSEYLSFAQENQELFNSIHMSRITVTSGEREARRILASINDGTTTFEDAARNHSQDSYADRGGDMGNRFVFELNREIPSAVEREIIYALGRGEISDIISTVDGWTFFRIENELFAPNFGDELVMERVRSYVRSFQRGRMEDWAINQAREFNQDVIESGLDDAARWWRLERQSFGPLSINFGSTDIFLSLDSFSIPGFSSQELSVLARNENFWRTAFITTQVNMPSEPLVHGNNVFVFIPIEETAADESQIENIALAYRSWWLNHVTQRTMQEYFLRNREKMTDLFWEAYFRYLSP